MSESIREQVFAAMAERLSTISLNPNARTVPVLITRALLSVDHYQAELAVGPVLGVMRSSGSTFDVETLDSHVHRLVVAVWGYVRVDGAALAGTWLERLWDDHLRCLLSDPKLGGIVRDLEPTGAMETDDGALEPNAFFVQDWLVTFAEPLD